MIYLVYQTTPLLGGIRPIMAYFSEEKAKEYCKKMNEHLDGYAYVTIPIAEMTSDVT